MEIFLNLTGFQIHYIAIYNFIRTLQIASLISRNGQIKMESILISPKLETQQPIIMAHLQQNNEHFGVMKIQKLRT